MERIEALGWDESWGEARLAAEEAAGRALDVARVVAEHRGRFVVDTGEGAQASKGERPAEPAATVH